MLPAKAGQFLIRLLRLLADSADAKIRFNFSVLAPFLSPELAPGFVPFDSTKVVKI
jgi:hypothetical protein